MLRRFTFLGMGLLLICLITIFQALFMHSELGTANASGGAAPHFPMQPGFKGEASYDGVRLGLLLHQVELSSPSDKPFFWAASEADDDDDEEAEAAVLPHESYLWIGSEAKDGDGDGSRRSAFHLGLRPARVWAFSEREEKRALLEGFFVPEVLAGYDALLYKGAPFQAENLFKFCVLYKFGGFYVSPGVTVVGPLPQNTDNVVLGSGLSDSIVDSSFLSANSRKSPFMKEMISFVILNVGTVADDSLLIEARMREKIGGAGPWTVLQCFCWRGESFTGKECEYKDPARPKGSPPSILTNGAHVSFQMETGVRLKSIYPRLGLHEIDPFELESVGRGGYEKPLVTPSSLDCDQCLQRSKGGGSCKLCRSCSSFCDSLCIESALVGNSNTVTMEVVPPRVDEAVAETIPFIVHQTWTSAAPIGSKMAKMQAGWKRSGFDYFFYDDAAARKFILHNFPPRILEAYDSIIPAGLKADLFKLSVLLLHGGVWADIDVLLETNLESVLSGFSFVGVVEAKHKDQAFCIYNGFIAATPNHPFIRSAFKRIVTNVLNRFDEDDITSEFLCGRGWNEGRDTDPKIWHIRASGLSYLTGPCNLGLGIKKAIGLNAFASIRPGVLDDGNLESVPGKSLFLDLKSRDFGSWRACERSGRVVVATNFNDFDELPTFCKNNHGGGTVTRGSVSNRYNCGDHTANLAVDKTHHSNMKVGEVLKNEAPRDGAEAVQKSQWKPVLINIKA